jgi:selenocysteine lyase/cysteine desulfurase
MSTSRRHFLGRFGAAAAALAAAPDRLLGRALRGSPGGRGLPRDADGLPVVPEGALDAEFWHELRKEFLLPPDEAFFNTGTLGSSPRVVLDAVVQHMTHVDRDLAHWDYKPDHEQYFTGYNPERWVREKLARVINAAPEEIALTQNATFGMNFIANGLSLGPGDEVLVVEGCHTGGRSGWELRDKRYGAHVKYVRPPFPPQDPRQLIDLYEQATTPQTRVWALEHLSSATAIRYPVEEMCRRARERGILTAVDGAQTIGHLAIDVQAMGCDFYFTSPHKWLLAPKGTGLLYIRRETQPRLWTTLASGEWDNHKDGAYRFMQYGTGNLSLLVGLEKAADFHLKLGPKRVEERILGLAERLRAGLQQIRGVRILSPTHPALLSATTIWSLDGVDHPALQDALWEQAKVRVRSVGTGVRQCCHIYNMEEEVDRSLQATRRLAQRA